MSTPLQPLRRPKFDWDEARRLKSEGMTYQAIATTFGVSRSAIERVCRTKQLEYTRRYSQERSVAKNPAYKTLCECGRTTRWFTHRCRLCMAEANATSVRDTTLRCGKCREWKPDDAFASDKSTPIRRHRNGWCRDCDTRAKRDYRARLKAAA